MPFPTAAAAVGAYLIILQMILMFNVGAHRARTRIGVGVGADEHLERKARRHANLSENAAIFIVVLALAELAGAPRTVALGFGAAFALARTAHAIGFASLEGSHRTKNPFFVAMRVSGALVTGLSGIGLGGYLAYLILAGAG